MRCLLAVVRGAVEVGSIQEGGQDSGVSALVLLTSPPPADGDRGGTEPERCSQSALQALTAGRLKHPHSQCRASQQTFLCFRKSNDCTSGWKSPQNQSIYLSDCPPCPS